MKKGDKILTQDRVKKLGLNKVPIITANMLEGYTYIGDYAFSHCTSLISIDIPDSVISIGRGAFFSCTGLSSVTIPNSVTSIEEFGFYECNNLTSITIPNSVTYIGGCAFHHCNNLTFVAIGNKIYENQTIVGAKCKAYKGFNADMSCRGFQYKEDETYELENEPILCKRGFHACLSLSDVFNYYYGELGKKIVIHEVELEGVSDECNKHDSKVVAKKITIGKRIL